MKRLCTPVLSCADGWTWKHFFASVVTWSDARSVPSQPGAEVLHRQGSSHRWRLNSGLRAGFAIPHDQDVKELSWAAESSFFSPPQLLLPICPAKTSAPGPFFSPLVSILFWPCQRIQYFLKYFFPCVWFVVTFLVWNYLGNSWTWWGIELTSVALQICSAERNP